MPVSTIALSGVMTRMPLVCISIVASAFQYGCAPTLIPATMTLISPPFWVNVTMRRSARATQSMFSVPLSIEMVAPEDKANHSTGTDSFFGEIERRDHPSTFGFGHRAQRLRRVTEQGHAGHSLGVARRRSRHHADDEAGGVASIRTVDGHKRAGRVEVVFDERALVAGENGDQLVGVDGAASL